MGHPFATSSPPLGIGPLTVLGLLGGRQGGFCFSVAAEAVLDTGHRTVCRDPDWRMPLLRECRPKELTLSTSVQLRFTPYLTIISRKKSLESSDRPLRRPLLWRDLLKRQCLSIVCRGSKPAACEFASAPSALGLLQPLGLRSRIPAPNLRSHLLEWFLGRDLPLWHAPVMSRSVIIPLSKAMGLGKLHVCILGGDLVLQRRFGLPSPPGRNQNRLSDIEMPKRPLSHSTRRLANLTKSINQLLAPTLGWDLYIIQICLHLMTPGMHLRGQ